MVVGIAYAVWTEPSQTPPDGNAEAPVNVGPLAQLKNGVLGVLGLMVYNDYDHNGVDVTGKVLTAQNAYGAVAWSAVAATGGASFTYYCNLATGALPTPPNICTNAGGRQGYCPSGFRQIYDLGSWGNCFRSDSYYFRPPGGGCPNVWYVLINGGEAYVCSE